MSPLNCNTETGHGTHLGSEGPWRRHFTGPGHMLFDAFVSLDETPQIGRVLRHPNRDLLSTRIELTQSEGDGYWDLARIRDGFHVITTDFTCKRAHVVQAPSDGFIQFNFRISGDLTLGASQMQCLRLNRPCVLVWAQSRGTDIELSIAPNVRQRFVSISLRPELLLENYLALMADVPVQLQRLVSGQRERMTYWQPPLSAHMFELANKLVNAPFTGALALLYTEALTLELMCEVIKILRRGDQATHDDLTERQLRCLHAARSVLSRQFTPVPTIRQLARSVGMAETSLTKSFKAAFGETIFDFSLRSRMQHALGLLCDHRWSVEQASCAVGYRHPTSFTTAFRRHFGIRPSDVRRKKSRPLITAYSFPSQRV